MGEVDRSSGQVRERSLARWSRWSCLVVAEPDLLSGWARHIPLPEEFEVYVDPDGVLRADHVLRWFSKRVLDLHYRMELTPK